MKRKTEQELIKIFKAMKNLEDGSYMTFIYVLKTSPFQHFKTFDVFKDTNDKNKMIFKHNNRRITKTNLLKKIDQHDDSKKLNLMVVLKNSNDKTEIFYDSYTNNLFEFN